MSSDRVGLRLRTVVAESLLVPAKTSSNPAPWIWCYDALHAPFALFCTARRYRVSLEEHELDVVCVGREQRFRFLLSRLFGDTMKLTSSTGRMPLWNPARVCTEGAAALTAVETHRWFADRFREAGWLICPDSVRWRGSLSEVPPANPSRSVRLDLSRPRRKGYSLEQAQGLPSDWDQFTDEMLIPHAERRFDGGMRLPVPALLRKLRSSGYLLFLIRAGERVAGQAVLCTRDEAWLAAIGVRGGDPALLREGVLAGLYALTIEWAKHRGMRFIDAGRSSAFERGGLAQYKRKWGMTAVCEPFSHPVALRVDPTNMPLRRALERQRFWVEDEVGELRLHPPDDGFDAPMASS
jgi:Acetyltransferase (GNAT) domain